MRGQGLHRHRFLHAAYLKHHVDPGVFVGLNENPGLLMPLEPGELRGDIVGSDREQGIHVATGGVSGGCPDLPGGGARQSNCCLRDPSTLGVSHRPVNRSSITSLAKGASRDYKKQHYEKSK